MHANSTWTKREAGRQAGSLALRWEKYAAAANANATIHKRRDAFTETTPICPPPPPPPLPPFAFLFFHRRCGGDAADSNPLPCPTPLKIAMIARSQGRGTASVVFALPLFSLHAPCASALLRFARICARHLTLLSR